MENIKILLSLGYEVSVASNFKKSGNISEDKSNQLKEILKKMNVNIYQVDFSRNISNLSSIWKAYSQLKVLSENDFDIVHAHSPIGGALTRLVFRRKNTKILYTAHGFHFYKGGPLVNWIFFYPLEKYLSRYTDILFTINNEDTLIAQKFKAKQNVQIPGIGFDTSKFGNQVNYVNLKDLQSDLNLKKNIPILISIGELNDNKNHISAIRALSKIKFDFYYIIIGIGSKENELVKEVQKLKLTDKIFFLGYKSNVQDYLNLADLSIFLSVREGLGMAGIESLASGVPLISSWTGGIKDYTEDSKTGFIVYDCLNIDEIKKNIEKYLELDFKVKNEMILYCKQISQKYSKEKVNSIMEDIYLSLVD